MDLTPTTVTFDLDEKDWLGSEHGTEMTTTGTLDMTAFDATAHYPKGFLPSGTVLGRITASGKYGPYDNAATDGTETAVGFLFERVRVIPFMASAASANIGCAIHRHGRVIASKLPFQTGTGSLDSAGIADLTHFIVD